MGGHRTLEGQRPVHPECPKLDRSNSKCQCDELWGYWDGTDAELDSLIKQCEYEESRNRQIQSAPSMQDGWPTELDDNPDDEDLAGFWRESERLKDLRKNRKDS